MENKQNEYITEIEKKKEKGKNIRKNGEKNLVKKREKNWEQNLIKIGGKLT